MGPFLYPVTEAQTAQKFGAVAPQPPGEKNPKHERKMRLDLVFKMRGSPASESVSIKS